MKTECTIIETRTGSGVTRRIEYRPYREKPRTPGVIYQDFFASPRLATWFDEHDSVIDQLIAEEEHEEYLKFLMEESRYRSRRRRHGRKASRKEVR